MEESETFKKALGLLNAKSYEESITLFRNDLIQNPKNFIAYNNIGVAQTHLGIDKKDKSLLESAIQHFQRAIVLSGEFLPVEEYKSAEQNLKWAKGELEKFLSE